MTHATGPHPFNNQVLLASPPGERFVSPINAVRHQLLMIHWFQPNSMIYRYFILFLYRILFL